MARLTAIGADDEQHVAAGFADRLHADFAIVAAVVLSLQCGTEEDGGRVIEAKAPVAEIRRLLASSQRMRVRTL